MWKLWRDGFAWWQRRFGGLGRFIGQHPLASLITSLLLAGLCCLGFLNASFVNQIDELWVPSTSATVRDSKSFNAAFTSDPFSRVERVVVVPKDPLVDMLQPEILAQVFGLKYGIFNLTVPAVPGDETDGQGRAGLSQMCAQLKQGGQCVYFDPLGYWQDNATYMFTRTPEELHSDANQLLLSGNIPVQQRVVLGCLVKEPTGLFDGDFKVASVGAFLFTFFMDNSRTSQATTQAWELALLDYLDSIQFPDIKAYASTGVSISQEISRQSGGDVLLLALVYVLMSIYMVLALTTFSPFKTRVLLGLGAVLTVLAGVISSLGFTALFWQFNPLTIQVLPFLMLSIGMDSVFILFSHYQTSIRSLPCGRPTTRADFALALEDAMYRQGASVALTALTKAVAFLGPAIVLRIPALQQFCIVVSISICFEVLLAFFCFCPMLVFDAMRENSHRADVLPCIKMPVVDAASDSGEVPVGEEGGCREGHDPTTLAPAMESGEGEQGAPDLGAKSFSTGEAPVDQGHSVKEPISAGVGGSRSSSELEEADSALDVSVDPRELTAHASARSKGAAPGAVDDAGVEAQLGGAAAGAGEGAGGEPPVRPAGSKGLLDLTRETERQKRTVLGRFVSHVYVPKVLASVWGQLAVYLVFAGLLAAGLYGCLTVNQSLDVRTLITEGTQLYNYLGYEDKCDTHIGPPVYLVTGAADYSQPQTADTVNALVSAVENSSYVEQPGFYSWYADFTQKFLPYSNWSTALDASGWPTSPQVFYSALDDFLNSIAGAMYKDNLSLQRSSAPGSPIVGVQSARMQGFYVPLNNTHDFVRAMIESREKVAEVPQISAYTQSYFYVFYEQFISIVDQYLAMLGLTVVAIFLVTLVFMGPKTAIVVSFLVLMIHVDMLGITSFMGVSMNAIAAVNAVAIMGLADEYVNYIMRAFELEEGTPEERIESALIQYLRPVSNAAISTWIGLLPIAFARSALYKVYYFRMFFVATLISWLTGVIFLPVLLLSTHGVGLGAPVKRLMLRLFKKNPKLQEIEG